MIDIVLATYNGENYLEAQIKSIQNNDSYQKEVARLIIVDDGSTDKTEDIIKLLAAVDPKIEWIINSSEKHGPSNNFSFGLGLTTADYIMLSDQDDIWLPDKIEVSLSHMNSLEKTSGLLPLLIFSDKEIVNSTLGLICDSYFTLKNIKRNWHLKFEQLCHQNVASGCTMLFNRELLIKALPVPSKAYMHDWWLVLVASRCGKIKLIDQPLIKYRQHDNNSIGARKINKLNLVFSFKSHLDKFEHSFLKTIDQAKAFRDYETAHELDKNETVNALANIPHLSRIERIRLFKGKQVTRSHFLGNFALLIILIKMKVLPKDST